MRIYDSEQFMELANISRPTLIKWQRMGLLEKKLLGNNKKALMFDDNDLKLVPKIKAQMELRKSTHNQHKSK
jgi:DNA-binding transcriptional MerR regulator